MKDIIVVGTGDVFRRFLAPSLGLLEAQRLLRALATVDIREREPMGCLSEGIEHRMRAFDEALSALLEDLKGKNPIVILAHDNDLHYQDTKDLVDSGFQVMLEKPYVIGKDQLDSFKQLVSEHPQRVFLMGYYFMRKMAPLLLLAGILRKDSFYLQTEEVFQRDGSANGLESYSGKLEEILGEPVSLKVRTLESAGFSGQLDHRGSYVFDVRRGGGMIQDMGIHALLPLFILDQYLGKVDISFAAGQVRTARCRECYNLSRSKYGIPEECIAETYSEIELQTEKGIPITVSVGKYTADVPTHKNLVLKGTKGEIDLDMHEHRMHIYKKGKLIDRIELINSPGSKYYPVLRTGLEYCNGGSPFTIDFSQKQLDAQELTLAILERARTTGQAVMYESGEQSENIFKHHAK